MPLAAFEPATPKNDQPQTLALDRSAFINNSTQIFLQILGRRG